MKTLLITIALAIVVNFSYAQFPQSLAENDSCCYITKDLRALIIDNEGSFVDVKIAKLPDEVIKIRVVGKNDVIYQTRIKKEEIVDLKFDLSNYPEGKYNFEILKKNKVVFSKEIDFNYGNIEYAKK